MESNRRSIKRKWQEWIASLESAHQTMLELVERDRAKVARILEKLGSGALWPHSAYTNHRAPDSLSAELMD